MFVLRYYFTKSIMKCSLFSFSAGAKPKVPPKLEYEVNAQGVLNIELEGSPEPLLQVKREGKILFVSSF